MVGVQLRQLGDMNRLAGSTQEPVGLCFSTEGMLQADSQCQAANEAAGRV